LPMAFDPLKSCSTTLPMTLDLLESFTTPAALDSSANSLLPGDLDPLAHMNISSIHSKEKLQKSSNLSAGYSLHSASTTNLSAVLDWHSTSCFKLKQSFVSKYVSNFKLVVVKFHQAIHEGIQAKLRQMIQVKSR
jgi:hypothetical protein